MASLAITIANGLWVASCLPEARRFRRAANRVQATQSQLLCHYLGANRDTEFGRQYDFAKIASVEEFQRAVPLTAYDDYVPLIERIGNGEKNLLTAEPVRIFELSSGSTAASKLVPYTATLQAEFQRAIAPWIFDVYTHYPQLARGTAYWSITPLSDGKRTTPGGIPIGFEEDSAYLGAWVKSLVDSALAVPNVVKQIQDIESFRYVTLLFLLRHADLRLISVWNPTFLSLLLAPLAEWWNCLLQDIADGTVTPPQKLSAELLQQIVRHLHPDMPRASALEKIRSSDYCSIWRSLGLISCWADGSATSYVHRLLQEQFPGVMLQGKGLLATEACVSFPLVGVDGSVLAVTSHFFEFLPIEETSINMVRPRLAHQLELNKQYVVVITTGGGFYRYQMRDVIQVTGFVEQVPCIRFVGKTDHVSDFFGEKLDERFVANVLAQLFARYAIAPRFAMLAPDDDAQGFRYALYLEADAHFAENLAQELDLALCQNFHYAYCRKLGQLATAHVVLIKSGASEIYLRACQARRQKLGNIKPTALHKSTDWRQWFEPSIK